MNDPIQQDKQSQQLFIEPEFQSKQFITKNQKQNKHPSKRIDENYAVYPIEKRNNQNFQESEQKQQFQYPHSKQMKKNVSKDIDFDKKSKRPSNSIPSNILRLLIQCLKDLLISQKQIYENVKIFIKSNNIKSQIWGVDAILFYVLYLKDCQKLLPQKLYSGILTLFISKLKVRQEKYKQDLSKQKITIFKLHSQFYTKQNITIHNLKDLQQNRKKLFDKLVKKKKTQVNRAIIKLEQIKNSLKVHKKTKD